MSLSNIQLERGAEATEFIQEDYDETLSKCQRFYQVGNVQQNQLVTGADRMFAFAQNVQFKETMRDTPTVTTTRVSATSTMDGTFGVEVVSDAYITNRGFLGATRFNSVGKASGKASLEYNWVADSELPVGWNNQIAPSHFTNEARQDGES